MTVQEAFTQISKAMSEHLCDEREANNIAHMLLEEITGMNRVDRIVYKDKGLTALQKEQLDEALTGLLKNRPIQYITGKSWFYGMELKVNEHVLIPRPETEELVEWIVAEVAADSHILDIGTGSGAIPIALKKALPLATVIAVDISESALEVAAANAAAQQKEITFLQFDILTMPVLPKVDVIVSNPPYICEKEKAGMQQQVLDFEPSIALFVPDNDPLLFYRQIGLLGLQFAKRLYFEINEAYGKEVVALLEEQGYADVTLKQDMFGKDRMVRAVKEIA